MKSIKKVIIFPPELFFSLEGLAIDKGITLSALIKMYLTKAVRNEEREENQKWTKLKKFNT